MKKTEQTANGTSFHSIVINATIEQMTSILGEPETGGIEDKVTHEWTGETENGDVFTVYDWKEYREFEPGEVIGWHIGGHSKFATEQARLEMIETLWPFPF